MAACSRLFLSKPGGQAFQHKQNHSSRQRGNTIQCSGSNRSGGENHMLTHSGDHHHHVRKEKITAVVIAKAALFASREAMSTSTAEVGEVIVDAGRVWVEIVVGVLQRLQAVIQKPTKSQVQMYIERAIVNCRFFTFLAVGGSLLGSVLCFVEGCFLVLQSYIHYFHILTVQTVDQGHAVKLIIEAVDMFLIGIAMLIFGMGLYAMYVGSKSMQGGHDDQLRLPKSNLFRLFHLKMLPSWLEMDSVSKAKSRIGHAVMMILQVGVLEKFKSVPLVTGLDLVCFAAAVFISSSSIFVLSKLSEPTKIEN